jgi:hypothetical protein
MGQVVAVSASWSCFVQKKIGKNRGNRIRAGVKKEMAKPRMASSAKIALLKLDTTRTPEQPSLTMPGTVNKIILARWPNRPEKAQIDVDGADRPHRNLQFENMLTDEYGDDVKLKKGAHVDVTITEGRKR